MILSIWVKGGSQKNGFYVNDFAQETITFLFICVTAKYVLKFKTKLIT